MEEFKYTINNNNIHIFDSYKICKKNFMSCLSLIYNDQPNDVLNCRSWNHLCLEWACHNFAYGLKIKPNSSKDVDLDYPQKWYFKVIYAVLGVLVWPFID